MFDVLVVEDQEVDVIFLRKAFERSDYAVNLHVVQDGEEALNFLYQRDQYKSSERPSLILLDIKMPRKSGHEVLSIIKADDDLKYIPVVMFSSSDAPSDVKKSYGHYANAYLQKPRNFEDMEDIVNVLCRFWLSHVKLP
ncbi:MAG: response regulator [Alphaproteobacteria bacterium]